MKNMSKKTIPLLHLPYDEGAKIIRLDGGRGLQNKLRVMGIREGETIRVVSKQPLRGPITIAVDGCQVTLGRGMARKIIVEVK